MIGPSDRNMTVLIIAQSIRDGEEELGYMHGLWRHHLLFDLLWFVEFGRTKKQSERRVRSWSWQNVEREIRQRLISDEINNVERNIAR